MIELRQIAKLFLRLTIVASMLSSVADRFGIWAKEVCMWGDMDKFVAYTQSLIPYIPADVVPILAWTATVLEVLFSLCLLLGLKLKWTASLTGLMILACGNGIWEVDNLIGNRRHKGRRIQMIR